MCYRRAMLAADKLTIPVPGRCPRCKTNGAARLQQTIRGRAILLNWVCSVCGAEWAIDDTYVPGR